jgi:HNH endonuclease/AP2 domain
MLTQERLKELLSYDPETGLLTRKFSNCNRIKAGGIAGGVSNRGYWWIRIDYKKYQAHRLAWLYIHGYWPTKLDHINRIKDDNRVKNLREVTSAENSWNRGLQSNNKSGYTGVMWSKKDKKWKAQIRVHGKQMHLGYFPTPEEAHAAYLAAKEKHHRIGERR